jgi:hypothetical protein
MIYIWLMGGRTRFSLAVGLATVVAVLGACKGSPETLGPAATVPLGTTTTNPYAVPAVIDEAYINVVLAGLDAAYGDILRMVVSTKTITREAVDRMTVLYAGDHRQRQLDLLARASDSGFSNYRQPPGNRKTLVSNLLTASSTCIFVEVARDYSDVALESTGKFRTQWLIIARESNSTSPYNPTGWILLYDGYEPDGSSPDNPCAS